LEDKLGAQGFHVLGFLSDDFGNQGGSSGQVDSCAAQYGVKFQQFGIDHVIDTDGAGPIKAQPVFAWLEGQSNPGPFATPYPDWNFHKYLISRTGKLVGHWTSTVYPGDDPANPSDSFDTSEIVIAIKAELAKP
jgi:glutathione peroxidase